MSLSIYMVAAIFAVFGIIIGFVVMRDGCYLAGIAIMCFSLAIATVSVPILVANWLSIQVSYTMLLSSATTLGSLGFIVCALAIAKHLNNRR